MFRTVQVDERLVEVIPCIEEMENSNGYQSRSRLWENNVHKDLQRGSPINFGGIVQFQRDRHEELTKQKHIVCICKKLRDDQRQESIHPAQLVKENIGGKQTHLARSEEHTSELQSRGHLVCRHLLEKKKK